MKGEKKTIWSLQNNKRKPEERNQFKATGNTKKSNSLTYGIVALSVIFLVSLLLIWMSPKPLSSCLTDNFCISSDSNVLLYALYVTFTIIILIFAVFGAYIVGKKLGERFKI